LDANQKQSVTVLTPARPVKRVITVPIALLVAVVVCVPTQKRSSKPFLKQMLNRRGSVKPSLKKEASAAAEVELTDTAGSMTSVLAFLLIKVDTVFLRILLL